MSQQRRPHYDYYLLVAHPAEPRVLVVEDGPTWSLPHVAATERRLWQSVDHLNRGMLDRLGLVTTVLRCVHHDFDAAAGRVQLVYAMESHSPAWSPPDGARWLRRDELRALPLDVPEHRQVLETWFAELAGGVPPARVPWARLGWFAEATAWIAGRLAAAGLAAGGPVEQPRCWARSCILRVGTVEGDLYFKAVPGMFAQEVPLTQALAAWRPDRFPTLVAADERRHWLLMRDYGGATLDKIADLAVWEEALREFARLQLAASGFVDRWRALGCRDRGLDSLAHGLDALLADADAIQLPGRGGGLTDEELAALRGRAPAFKRDCAALVRYGLPLTLEHGDFWAGQVVVRDGDFLFTDWSEASLSHPFFSPRLLLAWLDDGPFADVPDARRRLRDAYLGPWAPYGTHDELIAAFELAQPLAALHYALTYHQVVLPGLEPAARWEMERMIPFYLRLLLPAADE